MLAKILYTTAVSTLLLGNAAPIISATTDVPAEPEVSIVEEDSEDVIQLLETPIYIYGGGLTETQAIDLLETLGYKNVDDVYMTYATSEDLKRYLEDDDSTSVMKSSVVVEKQDDTLGITVEIVTPDNITLITPMQYEKAALSLGVKGVHLKVASPEKVTGESALTGVYKALELNGQEITQGQMDVVNAETELFADISESATGSEDFNPDNFTLAIAELQQQVKELKDKQEDFLTEEQIRELVDNILKEKGLDTILTEENITKLIALLELYQNTPEVIDNAYITEQTGEFITVLEDNLKSGWNYLKDGMEDFDSEQAQGIWENVQEFFQGIFDWFKNLFSEEDTDNSEQQSDSSQDISSESEISEEVDTSKSDSEVDTSEILEENPDVHTEEPFESDPTINSSQESQGEDDTTTNELPSLPVEGVEIIVPEIPIEDTEDTTLEEPESNDTVSSDNN